MESEEEGQRFFDYLQRYYEGVQVIGLAKVSAANRADDMLVNAMNGGEIDCIIAALSAPRRKISLLRIRTFWMCGSFWGLARRPFRYAGTGF